MLMEVMGLHLKIDLLDLSVNAFTDFGPDDESSDAFLIVLALAVLGFGITTLLAKRLLPIAILAVVFASFVLPGASPTSMTSSRRPTSVTVLTWTSQSALAFRSCCSAAGAGLAGGIVALATRRR